MCNIDIIWEPFSWKEWKWTRRFVMWKCICGNIKKYSLSKLKSWYHKSCWCLQHIGSHWKSKHPLYKIYCWIIERCNNSNNPNYHRYWWRWIRCEWIEFEHFYNDMIWWYNEWLQIDRINNDWNYSKQNCRWVTSKQNCRNQSKTLMYKWISLRDYCDNNDISRNIVRHAIYHKWLDINYVIDNISTINSPSYIYKHYKSNRISYQVKIKWISYWYKKTEEDAIKHRDFLLSIQ